MSSNNNLVAVPDLDLNATQWDISIFEIDKNKGMVNLTKIAKHFNVETKEWKKLKGTQDYLKAYSEITEKVMGEIITSLKGNYTDGSEQGTWAERKIAIRFMQWIKPEFAVWADFKLDELFQKGTVSLGIPQSYAQALLEAGRLALEVETLQLEAKGNKPKVEFANQLLEATNGIDFGTSAKAMQLPFGRNTLFSICREQGWLFGMNQPKQSLVDSGYFVVLESTWTNPKTMDKIATTKTLITTKGQEWLLRNLRKLNKIK